MTIELDRALTDLLPRESFVPASLHALKPFHARVLSDDAYSARNPAAARFWRDNAEQISTIIARADELGPLLAAQKLPQVLCHADIHTANVMVDDEGGLHYVDWDGPMIAPRERDLKFIMGGSIGDPVTPDQETHFLAGYGDITLNTIALAYYRYEWVIEDIADYGHQLFDDTGRSAESQRDALSSVRRIFGPGDVADMANQAYASI